MVDFALFSWPSFLRFEGARVFRSGFQLLQRSKLHILSTRFFFKTSGRGSASAREAPSSSVLQNFVQIFAEEEISTICRSVKFEKSADFHDLEGTGEFLAVPVANTARRSLHNWLQGSRQNSSMFKSFSNLM